MSNLTDITAVFAAANNVFEPIACKPNNADLQRLNKVLVVCSLFVFVTFTGMRASFPSDGVLSDAVYLSAT